MATLRERDVFEYCENLFEKLKKEDGGYYPHKHDRLGGKFGIGIINLADIFITYRKMLSGCLKNQTIMFMWVITAIFLFQLLK